VENDRISHRDTHVPDDKLPIVPDLVEVVVYTTAKTLGLADEEADSRDFTSQDTETTSAPVTPDVESRAARGARSRAAAAQKRDKKGRFSGEYVTMENTSSQRTTPRERSRTRSRSATTNSQKRDTKGRFVKEYVTMEETNIAPVTPDEESRAERSARSQAAATQKMDAWGRFSGEYVTMENTSTQRKTPKERSRSRSRTSSRSAITTSQKRDAYERFIRERLATEDTFSTEDDPSMTGSQSGSKSLKRDSKGRFSSVYIATEETPSMTEDTPTYRREKLRGRSRSRSRSVATSSQKRDSRGRFSREHVATEDASPVFKREVSRGRSRSRSSRSVATGSQKRDSNGRFSRGLVATDDAPTIEASSSISGREISKERSISRSKSATALSQKKDSKGRFIIEHVAAEISRIALEKEVEDAALSTLAEVGAAQERDEKGKFKKASTKAKTTPAKSPYFPPVPSPPKTHTPIAPSIEEGEPSTKVTPKKRSSSKTPKTPQTKVDGEETPKRPRTPGGIVSCIPFPPLSAPYFGLIQEKLAHNPFHLLIAVTFLIRTHGKHAIPVFYELIEKYPTPEALASADKEDIVPIIRHLGLQNQRAGTYQTYAKIWLEDPPAKGKRYAVRDYPTKGSGRDVKKDEILADDDERVGWEIGHMTQGPYAIDSWRIFCRDVLRGLADGWNGEGNTQEGFQPEWMRVLPTDKELRAYLRWMWLKEGFAWDPFTGEKEVASERLMRAAIEGRIAWDEQGGMRIVDESGEQGGDAEAAGQGPGMERVAAATVGGG
jgi:methyl-CpG-binding domain protein 4